MKIIDRAAFLALPPEIVFAKYVPSVFEALQIKGETIYADGEAIDYFYQDLLSGECMGLGSALQMDFETQGRDGCFDDGQLFAVMSRQDVTALIERLGRCL